MLREVGFGPEVSRRPWPASCKRTFIISMGWITVVADMPARPLGRVLDGLGWW